MRNKFGLRREKSVVVLNLDNSALFVGVVLRKRVLAELRGESEREV